MISYDVEIDFKDSICKNCGNLRYWDGYFCFVKDFDILDPEVERSILTNTLKCDKFIERKLQPECKMNTCRFWCEDCEGFKNRWESLV